MSDGWDFPPRTISAVVFAAILISINLLDDEGKIRDNVFQEIFGKELELLRCVVG